MNKTEITKLENLLAVYLPSSYEFSEHRQAEYLLQISVLGTDIHNEIRVNYGGVLTDVAGVNSDLRHEINTTLKKKAKTYMYVDRSDGKHYNFDAKVREFFENNVSGVPTPLHIHSTSIFSKRGDTKCELVFDKAECDIHKFDIYVHALHNPAFARIDAEFKEKRLVLWNEFYTKLPELLNLKREIFDPKAKQKFESVKRFDMYLRKKCFAPASVDRDLVDNYLYPNYVHELVGYFREMQQDVRMFID